MDYNATCGDSKLNISEVSLFENSISQVTPNRIHIKYKNKNYVFHIESISIKEKEVVLKLVQRKMKIQIQDQLQQMIQSLGYNTLKSKHADSLKAPMPGLVLDVMVKSGQEVKKGDPLITLEAMKMENILKAAHDGWIKEITVAKSDKVEKNQILLLFDETK